MNKLKELLEKKKEKLREEARLFKKFEKVDLNQRKIHYKRWQYYAHELTEIGNAYNVLHRNGLLDNVAYNTYTQAIDNVFEEARCELLNKKID